MGYYDAPPLRSHRPSRRRDSFSTPPFRSTAAFYPTEPQNAGHADDYPRGRAHSPLRSAGGMPRIYRVSAGEGTYVYSPTRSSSPPGFYAEKNSYYDTPKSRSACRDSYDEYDVPSSPPPHSRSQPKAQDSYFPPPPTAIDTTPEPYTYDDEEPERIPIAPMMWNGYASSASKEELINFFVDRGIHPKRAAAQVDREFTAHAPQHLAGQDEPGLPRAQIPASARDTPPWPRRREESDSGSGSGHRSTRTRHRSPPPAAYRSTSPVSGPGPRHRSSSSSGSGSGSSSRYHAHSPPRRTASRREGEGRGERRERKESRAAGTTPLRAPSPPPVVSRGEADRERRHRSRRD